MDRFVTVPEPAIMRANCSANHPAWKHEIVGHVRDDGRPTEIVWDLCATRSLSREEHGAAVAAVEAWEGRAEEA